MQTRSTFAGILFLLIGLSAGRASAQAPLMFGLGGTADLGEGSLAPNDDGSSAFIDLSSAFPVGLRFYGMVYPGVYVNNNGNISFGAPLGAFTASAFPLAASQPAMIAPWWGDFDTRNRTGVGTGNLVYWDITPGQFVVTWYDGGYYSQHNDHRVSVQLIITDASAFGIAGAFDVEIRYNRCEWTTGDASGGTGGFGGNRAGAGFDAADGTNFRELTGSRTATVVNLCTLAPSGLPGVQRFQVRPSGVTICGNGVRELGEECDDANVTNGDGCNSRCSTELLAGVACGDDIACRSGFCVDGVCCNARCDGQCEACGEPSTLGACTAVTGAPRGARPTCFGGGTTCGGSCGGTDRASCTLPGSGVSCDDGSACSISDVCDGAGGCAGVGLICDDGLSCTADSCAAGVCGAALIAGQCLIDGACVAAGDVNPAAQCEVCDPTVSTTAWSPRTGTCDDGNACTVGDACDAGLCASGVTTTCADDGLGCTAEACNTLTGACDTTVTDGCVIDGACVATGTLDPTTTCRSCDPSKDPLAYSSLDTGTRCAEPSCMDGVLTLAAECDGLGTCVTPTTTPCTDGRCADAIMCMGGCGSDAECPADRYCDAGVCVDDLGPGTACDREEVCASGFCTDGVCCGTSCDGTCEACNVTGAEGTCTPHAAGTDPDDECLDPLSCDGESACEMPVIDVDGGVPRTDAGARDAGGRDGGGRDAGGRDAGMATGDAGGGFDGGAGGLAGGGCGCAVPGGERHDRSGAALLALGLALVIARRKKR
jgi:hypothetical protein